MLTRTKTIPVIGSVTIIHDHHLITSRARSNKGTSFQVWYNFYLQCIKNFFWHCFHVFLCVCVQVRAPCRPVTPMRRTCSPCPVGLFHVGVLPHLTTALALEQTLTQILVPEGSSIRIKLEAITIKLDSWCHPHKGILVLG